MQRRRAEARRRRAARSGARARGCPRAARAAAADRIGNTRDPVPEVLAERALARPSSRRSRCVAATMRTSTVHRALAADALERAVLQHAQQAHLRRRAAARRSRRGTASRRRRARTSPARRATAPVKLPRSWPNSSESISSGGIAPQFTRRNGPAARARARVDRARDHLLARAGLAEDQHRHVERARPAPTRSITGAQARLGADDRVAELRAPEPREQRAAVGLGGLAQRARARAAGGRSRARPRSGSSSARAIASCSASKRLPRRATSSEHARAARSVEASGPTSTSPSTPSGSSARQLSAQRAARAACSSAPPRHQASSASSSSAPSSRARRRRVARPRSARPRASRRMRRARSSSRTASCVERQRGARAAGRRSSTASPSSRCRQASRQTSSSSGAESLHGRRIVIAVVHRTTEDVQRHMLESRSQHSQLTETRRSSGSMRLAGAGTRLARRPPPDPDGGSTVRVHAATAARPRASRPPRSLARRRRAGATPTRDLERLEALEQEVAMLRAQARGAGGGAGREGEPHADRRRRRRRLLPAVAGPSVPAQAARLRAGRRALASRTRGRRRTTPSCSAACGPIFEGTLVRSHRLPHHAGLREQHARALQTPTLNLRYFPQAQLQAGKFKPPVRPRAAPVGHGDDVHRARASRRARPEPRPRRACCTASSREGLLQLPARRL